MRWTRVILLTVAMLGMSIVAWAGADPPAPTPPSDSTPALSAAPTTGATAPAGAVATHDQGSSEKSDEGLGMMALFIVFILTCFLGVELINKVPPTLHTPLMSGSNAMSGITIVGALMLTNLEGGDISIAGYNCDLAAILGFVALVFATINVVGGFMVTDRMLKMFKKGS